MAEQAKTNSFQIYRSFVPLAVILIILYFVHNHSYPQFHTLIEVFCVVIAGGIFALAWNSRKFADNSYILLVGVALLFIGLIDLLHAMAYKGINVFNTSGSNLPTQLWVIGRLLEAVSLVIAPLFINKKTRPALIFFIYSAVTVVLLLSVFVFHNFPAAYVDGLRLTRFKIGSEYAVIALFALAAWLLYRQRKTFETKVAGLLISAILIKILAEIMFTLYVDVFSLANYLGHVFKLISYYLFYLGIIETTLTHPYHTLFKNLKDSETFLKESEQRYRALIEYSPNSIFLHSDNIITYINPAGVRLFGADRPEQIVGKNLLDFIDQPFKSFVKSRDDSIYLGAKFVPVAEIRIITLAGKTVEADSTSSLINLGGKFAGQTIIRDITIRKNVEKKLAEHTKKIEAFANDLKKFQLAVENASDSIIITNPELKIIYANQAMEKTTGYLINEAIGRHASFLWLDQAAKNDFQNKIIAFCRNLKGTAVDERQTLAREMINRRKDGSNYMALINISPVFDENKGIVFFVIIERDITKLKEVDLAKTEFVSLASHQLRTPLSSISLSAELLLRGIAGPIEDKTKKYIMEIFNASKKMKELIEALLNITRIEMGTFMIKPETINLSEAIEEILKEQIAAAKDKGLVFLIDRGKNLPPIHFDKNILNIVIDNLIANAIRYTPAGGQITLTAEKRAGEILISVADTGCGIPRGEQAKVFEKLFRAGNAKQVSAEGVGLGLYMARSMLKKAGGKIWFESEEGKGSTFFVTIPLE